MRRISLTVLFFLILAAPLYAEIKGKEVEYKAGDVIFKGYLAYDDGFSEKRPGILVVHEWWGHNDYARKRARMLAEVGYTALAVDMYGDGKTAQHPDDAGLFSQEVMQSLDIMQARFLAAEDVLKKHPSVDPQRIAAIGYCFGGGVVLHMARLGADLDGVVSFHGSLGSKVIARPGEVKAKILVCHGAADEFIPLEQIEAFKKEMEEAKADYRFIAYEAAKHSFTNPEADEYAKRFNLPIAYNQKADQQSWKDMLKFFREIF